MEIEVRVFALIPDPHLGSMLVVLKEVSGEKILPIMVGMLEGGAIFMGVENIKLLRPLTHDLFKDILVEYAIHIEKVVIIDVVDSTYYASLYVKNADHSACIDARPSDAIAIALRFGCPLYVESHVFEKTESMKQPQESEDEMYERALRSMDPEKMPKA